MVGEFAPSSLAKLSIFLFAFLRMVGHPLKVKPIRRKERENDKAFSAQDTSTR